MTDEYRQALTTVIAVLQAVLAMESTKGKILGTLALDLVNATAAVLDEIGGRLDYAYLDRLKEMEEAS